MSNLYIRVMTDFYCNRKTVKLKIKLGNDAFWIPPRLWAYAAEHQPDGDLSKYSSEELAELLGCQKHASSMLQALKECGFIDESGIIHDWETHNGYHKSYSERAKKAAAARWDKEKSPAPPKEKTEKGKRKEESGDKHCIKHAPSINGSESTSDFGLVEKTICRLYNRPEGTPLTYMEQSGIAEMLRRPAWKAELQEIEAFAAKKDSFFPQSASRLLTSWQETLDRSRTHGQRNQTPQANGQFKKVDNRSLAEKLIDEIK